MTAIRTGTQVERRARWVTALLLAPSAFWYLALLVVPLAFICGAMRGIPVYWRLIDCSFGVFGVVPLLYCLRLLPRIEASGPLGTGETKPEA